MRNQQPAVVHGWQDRGLGMLAAVLAAVPVRVVTVHMLERDLGQAQRLVDRLIFNHLATRTIAVSRSLATEIRMVHRTPSRRLAVLRNGVSDARVRGGDALDRRTLAIDARAPVLLFAGRLVHDKGADVALAVMAHVAERRPDARLVVIGDGPERARLEAQARALGIRGRVHFAGHQSEPGPWYRLASVVLVPSRREALGMVAVEAMAAARPVVASRVGGLPEVVVEGVTGLLPAPVKDVAQIEDLDPRPLAGAVLALLAEPERAGALGAAGRRRYEAHFRIEDCVRRYEQAYEHLWRRRRSSFDRMRLPFV